MSWDVLVEIDIAGATLRYSIAGTATDSGSYAPDIVAVGDIQREIDFAGGLAPAVSGYVEIHDRDGLLRKALTAEGWRGAQVRTYLAEIRTGQAHQIASGQLIEWASDVELVTLDWRDTSWDRFGETASPIMTWAWLFPHMPAETGLSYIPIVLGRVSSANFAARGAIPGRLIDPRSGQSKYRWVLAQHPLRQVTGVWIDGELVSPSKYTVTYADVTGTPYGTVRMTFLDFSTDPRPRMESQLTYDAEGLTDDGTETGPLVTNPAEALRRLLELRDTASSGEWDEERYSRAVSAATALGLTAGYAITEELSWAEVIDEIGRSYRISLWRGRSGKLAMYLDDGAASEAVADLRPYDEGVELDVRPSEAPYSTAVIGYAQDFAAGRPGAQIRRQSSSELERLGRDVTDDLALPGIRSANEAATLAQIDCYRRSSARQYLTLSATPQPSLEPGDVVTVTHWGGMSSDGLGYRALAARLQRLAYVVDGAAVWCSIVAVDEPGVTLTEPGLTDTGRDPAPPPPGGQGVEATIVWQPSSQSVVSWTAGQVAVWGPSGWTLYNVVAGNTGTISSGRRYVYLDPDVDETHLLVTDSLDVVAGGRRQLLATVTRGSTSYYVASIRAIAGQVRVDSYAMERRVSGSDIPSSTIHADHISAGSITASKISVSYLSAISANLGTITAGKITGATIQTATSGARVVLDSTGFRSYDSGGNVLVSIPTSGDDQGRIQISFGTTSYIAFGGVASILSYTYISPATGLNTPVLEVKKVTTVAADLALGSGFAYTELKGGETKVSSVNNARISAGLYLYLSAGGGIIYASGNLLPSGSANLGASTSYWGSGYITSAYTKYLYCTGSAYTGGGIEIRNSSGTKIGAMGYVTDNRNAGLEWGNGSSARGIIWLHRKTTAGNVAPVYALENKNGSTYYLWVDANGKLRIHTSDPLSAGDTAGTIVGTQE